MCAGSRDDDVDTCINRQRSAVDGQVVKMWVVLPLSIEEARVIIPRAVDDPLHIAGG
jgi:hypothetical protein